MKCKCSLCAAVIAISCVAAGSHPAYCQLDFHAEKLVQAGGATIDVPGYSVPSFVHWNADGLEDLVIGEGSGTFTPKVRVYLNVGTAGSPQFSTFFYAQSLGSDLTVPGGG